MGYGITQEKKNVGYGQHVLEERRKSQKMKSRDLGWGPNVLEKGLSFSHRGASF